MTTGPIAVAPGADLAAIIAAAPPGATLALADGHHALAGPLVITRSIALIGTGRDRCRIVSRALGLAIHVAGAERFGALDLAFEHEGEGWAHIMRIDDAELLLRGCRFRDHERHEPRPDLGDGLRVGGTARGLIADCEFVDNGHRGLVLAGRSDVRVAGCAFLDNRDAGLAIGERARGTIERCRADRNGVGVLVDGDAAPRLFDVAVRASGRDGFVWRDHGHGRAAACVAEDNRDGFAIGDQARPTLSAPVAVRNRECGVHLTGRAAPILLGARVHENRGPGVIAADRTAPDLRGGRITHNGRVGLAFLDEASGEVARCEVADHRVNGVCVHQRARPVLRRNVIRANGWAGLHYAEHATGEAEGNLIERNGGDGVQVQDQAAPRLRGNLARSNACHGFSIAAGAAAYLADNGAEDNPVGAYAVARPPRFGKPAALLMRNVDGPIAVPEAPLDELRRGPIAPGRDVRTLIEAAEPGALLELGPGEFDLGGGATRRGDLVIRGAGQDRTIVHGGTGEHVLRFDGPGQLLLDGLTLERRSWYGPVVVVAGGEVEAVDATIRGGKRKPGEAEGGDGVRILVPSRVVLRGSRVAHNQGWGVFATASGARVVFDAVALTMNESGPSCLPASPTAPGSPTS